MTYYLTTPEQFTEEVINFDGIVLVDFYADRCGPCRMLSPIIDELAKTYEGNNNVKIVKVNIDENDETANEYKIMSIPTVIIFKKGKELSTYNSVQTKEEYESKINSLLD